VGTTRPVRSWHEGPPRGSQPSPPVDAALEDGRHFGYVRSVDGDAGTIEFDLAYFLSGEEANAAYQAAGGTGPVPNDHFVVNDNPKLRTLPLAPDVRLRLLDWNHCCETFFDGDLALFGQAIAKQGDVTEGDLIYRGQSQWWITVENGFVTRSRSSTRRNRYWFSPWKISETLLSSNTARSASAISGAIESTFSFPNRFSSGIGIVFVTTTSVIGASSRFCTALPESTGWVAAA
jgi:hypothetical protein